MASKTLLKAGSANDGVDQVLSGALGAAVLTAAKQAVKMPFLEVHKERASLWKKLLDKLRAALAKAQAETRAPRVVRNIGSGPFVGTRSSPRSYAPHLR